MVRAGRLRASAGACTRTGDALQLMRVDDEPGVPGYLVVERPAGAVRNLRLPVNPAASCSFGSFIHAKYELATNSAAAKLRRGKQVLQIADVLQAGSAAMKDEVCETDKTLAC